MAEINEVVERMIAQHMEVLSIPGGVLGYLVATSDMSELLAELESARSELDAIKEEYKAFRVFAHKTILASSNAALNTQPAPQAEWTPELGSEVRITEAANHSGLGQYVGRYGVVVEFRTTLSGVQYVVTFHGFISQHTFALLELTPVDESAPQAEWTPRLGERVRVKPDFDVWFYREHGHMPPRISGHDIVIAGETDHNGTHVRNLEDNAGALIPPKFLEPLTE